MAATQTLPPPAVAPAEDSTAAGERSQSERTGMGPPGVGQAVGGQAGGGQAGGGQAGGGQTGGDQTGGAQAETERMGGEKALLHSPPALEMPRPIELTPQVARLPVELDVAVPVRDFRVRNLLALEPAQLVESGWGHGDDVPLAARAVQLAWCEFEVVGTVLAVRVTRLA